MPKDTPSRNTKTQTLIAPSPLHLLALSAFAITQPLFEKLSGGAEFFIAKQSEPIDLVLFTLAVALIPGILLAGSVVLAGLVSLRLRFLLHLLLVAALLALILLPPLAHLAGVSGRVAIPLSLLISFAITHLYRRSRSFQGLVSYLGLFVVISPLLFLSSSGIRPLLSLSEGASKNSVERGETPPSIIFLVFDEFPLSVLLNRNLTIDEDRYPNFARLARDSFWFRNATAVSTHTTLAVPAILTGMTPTEERKLPTANVHPHSLFSLLGNSHQMHVWERITNLCPRTLCAGQRPILPLTERLESLFEDALAVYLHIVTPSDIDIGLPPITLNWGGFWERGRKIKKGGDFRRKGRMGIARNFISEIHASDKPFLHFAHHLLPHMPYQFLPSGNAYSAPDAPRGYEGDKWTDDDWKLTLAYSGLMHQVAAVDTFLGELMTHLSSMGLYDSSLIVITADHGVTFEPRSHRRGDPENERFYEDILSIPLFIKTPNQHEGHLIDKNVESIDILPTIADILDVTPQQKLDGSSIVDDSITPRTEKRLILGVKHRDRRSGDLSRAYEAIEYPVPNSLPRKTLDWKIERFGDGSRKFGKFLPEPVPHLLGIPLTKTLLGTPRESTGSFAAPVRRLKDGGYGIIARKGKESLPFLLSGTISTIPASTPLALTFNDTIVSLTRAEGDMFQFLIPEEAYENEVSRARLFAISGGGTTLHEIALLP